MKSILIHFGINNLWGFLLYVIFYLKFIYGANILALFPHNDENHFILMRTLMIELARQEHNITLYTGHRLNEKIDHVQEYKIEPEFQFWHHVRKSADIKDSFLELASLDDIALEKSLALAGYDLGDYFLSNSHIQKLIRIVPDNFTYDLIVVDLFYTEALLGLSYYFKIPCIGILSSDFANYMDLTIENIVPSACLPYDFHNYGTLNVDFWQRVKNINQCKNRRERMISGHYTYQRNLLKKYLPPIKNDDLPTISELQMQISLLLINNYIPFLTTRPMLMNMIPVGGIHISTLHELPWNIKRFLDGARFGAIFIHLSDYYHCSSLNRERIKILMQVLSKRKEHVLWTCHNTLNEDSNLNLKNLSGNIMIQHMVSQTDILAHPHIKLFITNGNLLDIQTSIIRHVPILGITLFSNELKNMQKVEALQIGLQLDYTNVTELSLNWALESLLHNEYYILNIRGVSKVFRDRPLGGLASAIFWINFILRYGSSSLKSRTINVTLNELHLIDLFIFYILKGLFILSVITGLIFGALKIYRKRNATKIIGKIN